MSVPTNSSLSPFSISHLTASFPSHTGPELADKSNSLKYKPKKEESKVSSLLKLPSGKNQH